MRPFAMRTNPTRVVSHGRLAWLLVLALLLPVAQAAATLHALSHTGAHAGDTSDDKQAPQATHCGLCVTAATVGTGVPASGMPSLPLPLARHEQAGSVLRALGPTAFARAYRSRAPPLASS
jgi:hypothetical protein